MGIAGLLYLITGGYGAGPWTRCLYVLSVIYATFLWHYLRRQNFEIYQIFFFLAFFHFAVRFLRTSVRRHAQFAWFFLAGLVLIKLSFIVYVPVFALAVYSHLPIKNRKQALILQCLMPSALICFSQAYVNWFKFGSIFLTGYQQSDLGLHWTPKTPFEATVSILWSQKRSVFLYFPPLLFALFSYRLSFKRFRTESLFILGIFLAHFISLINYAGWDGGGSGGYGPRYLVVILPVLSLPFLFMLTDLKSRLPSFPAFAKALPVLACLVFSSVLQWNYGLLGFEWRSGFILPATRQSNNLAIPWLYRSHDAYLVMRLRESV